MAYTTDAPLLDHAINGLVRRINDAIRARRRRRGFRKLLDLDDHLLDDMGVTRSEVIYAAGLPISINAATELRRMSNERRRLRM